MESGSCSGGCSFHKLKMGSYHFCFFIYHCDERQFGRFSTTWLLLALKNILVACFLMEINYKIDIITYLNTLFLLHPTYYVLYNNVDKIIKTKFKLWISIKIYQTSDFMKNIDFGPSFGNCYKTFFVVWLD